MTQKPRVSAKFLPPAPFSDPTLTTLWDEINGCYQKHWFNACAVLCRRLTESLLVRAFCAAGHRERVFHTKNGWCSLGTLAGLTRSRQFIEVSQTTLAFLTEIRKLGNQAAHHPYESVEKNQLDQLRNSLVRVMQELAPSPEGLDSEISCEDDE